MIDPGEAMLDAKLAASHVEHVGHESGGSAVGVARREAELDAVIGQNGVDRVGHRHDQGDEKGGDPDGLLDRSDEGELAGPNR
jgi:hypothetical protein